MPQDVPLEASETLAFIPDSLANMEEAPRFTLRTITTRDTRFLRRLNREEGVSRHSEEAQRAEILNGLKDLWTPEAFEEHKPVLEAYWEAWDQFQLQRADDPELRWAYDREIERAIHELIERVTDAWAPLRRMIADNLEATELTPLLMMAVAVKSWAGLAVPRDLDRGYITLDCAERLRDALTAFAEPHLGKDKASLPAQELFIAAVQCFRLDEDVEKNSASPSPSETTQTTSGTGKGKTAGKSPASASSTTTRETA